MLFYKDVAAAEMSSKACYALDYFDDMKDLMVADLVVIKGPIGGVG